MNTNITYDKEQRVETFSFDPNNFDIKDIIHLTKRYFPYDWTKKLNLSIEHKENECKVSIDWSNQKYGDKHFVIVPDFLEVNKLGFVFTKEHKWVIPDEYKELIDQCYYLKDFAKEYNIMDEFNVKYKVGISSLNYALNRYNPNPGKIVNKQIQFNEKFDNLINFAVYCREFYSGFPKKKADLEISSYFDTSYVKYVFELYNVKDFLSLENQKKFNLKFNKYSNTLGVFGINVIKNSNLKHFTHNKDILYLLNFAREEGRNY